MSKLLILSAMAFFVALMPIAPALACFPNADADEILFAPALRGRSSTTDDYETERVGEGAYGGRSFDRAPISMSFCELPEPGFVVVKGKCYDFDAITDFDTEEECQADPVCKAYREQQQKDTEPKYDACGCPIAEGIKCQQEACLAEDEEPIERTDDPNHGEIKGDEELGQDQEQDEEEHQEEEEQGQEKSEETTSETDE